MDQKRFLTGSVDTLSQDHAFNGVDLVKLLCAFLILMIHVKPFQTDIDLLGFGPFNFWIVQGICRVAVPFYFVSSGFLLFRKSDLYPPNGQRIKGFAFKNLRLLGTWFVLLIVGEQYQLWFIGSLVFAVIILTFLLKKEVPLRILVLLAVVFFAVGLIGDAYSFLLEPLRAYSIPKVLLDAYETVFHSTRNGMFFGFVFVLMGALFAKKRIVLRPVTAWIGFAVSMAFLLAEAFLLHRFANSTKFNLLAFQLPAAFFLFYLASHLNLKNDPIFARLRSIGVLVFFLHMIADFFVKWTIEVANATLGFDISSLHFLMTVCLTVAVAIGVEYASQKEKLQWLKNLYA